MTGPAHGVLFRRATVLATLLACLLPASALGFSGAVVPGSSFVTDFGAHNLMIRIKCPAGTKSGPAPGDFSFCTGTLSLSLNGHRIAGGPFSVRTFDSHLEPFRLQGSARHLFRPHASRRVHYRIFSHDGEGNVAAHQGNVTVKNPYNR